MDVDLHALEHEYELFGHHSEYGLDFGQLRLSIMHGDGNVIAVLDEALSGIEPRVATGLLAKAICQSFHTVRVDGIAFLRTEAGTVRMTYFERDGTNSAMCGNALRCATRYCAERGYVAETDTIHTDDGPKWVSTADGVVRVSLGPGREYRALAPDRYFVFSALAHLVVLVADLAEVDVRTEGAALRHDTRLCRWLGHPEGLHVDFLRPQPHEIAIRTYEVGVEDETLACGTGAAGCAFVANQAWGMPFPIRVRTLGGVLTVTDSEHGLLLSGATDYLFSNVLTAGSGRS